MPVISNPPFSPTSCYQPVQYEVFSTVALPDTIAYCRFTVYVDGVAIATDRKSPYRTNPAFGLVEYYFLIDVQQYLQRYFSDKSIRYSMFGDLGAATQTDNPDAYAQVDVDFEYLILSGTTGKISLSPVSDSAGTVFACIAKRQNGDDRSLSAYLGTPGVTPIQYLTNSPLIQDVCSDTNTFVSFLENMNYMRVQTYTAGGAQISDTYAPTGSAANQQTTVGVGIPQLNAITNWFNGIAPTFTGAAYYVITFGTGIPAGPFIIFVGNTIQKTYNITECCSKKLRFYWLNDLGGVDNYELPFLQRDVNVKGDIYEKPLGWDNLNAPYHNQSDYGKAKNNLQADRFYVIDTIIAPELMVWLRELLYSAEVYIQNPDGSDNYWRVFLSDITQTDKRSRGLIELQMQVNLSQQIVTHRV